ncbi:MAG: FKBP-type peptidyl-prolyl cis-trans isomerase [Bacteroidales bacterium]|nr:FKBP-type peptidyl-prolyl cis-trans isomerase [Candidatus Equibacterium intestinale]
MEINDNKVVHLVYQLEVDGQIADSCTAEKPLEFIFGLGYLLPKFEENIAGKTVGDKFDFRLTAAEGYGEIDPNAIIDLPKNIFEIDGKLAEDILFEGNVIPMMNSMGGVMPGKVVKVNPDTVTMDFNPQMAGKDLHFTGEILLVREATDKELTEGLHGERKGCGGNCSSCGGNCGEEGCDKESCDCK